MIDISPKALRFARLAAEQQPLFAHDPHVDVMRHVENLWTKAVLSQREKIDIKYIEISEDTAFFCLKVIDAFLEQPDRHDSRDWDGNDVEFMQIVVNDMHQQLALSPGI